MIFITLVSEASLNFAIGIERGYINYFLETAVYFVNL